MSTGGRDLILVVDDNEANRYVLSRLLQKAGYETFEAGSLAEAEGMLGREPDLMVLDVNLPDGKGTDFARRVKADPTTAPIMVLNVSASFTRTRDRVEGLESGADGYLLEPIDPPEFLATVRSLLRIRQAEETVRRKNADLVLFAHAISHDLREPLRMVSSYLDLLRRRAAQGLDDQHRQYVDHALSAALRMRGMIDGLLSLATADQGGLKRERIEARAVVDQALASLSVMVAQVAPELRIGPLPTVVCDPGLLAEVFQNLLANAMKYRAPRPVEISIEAASTGGATVFTVTDNGIGIPASQLASVFVVFKRVHAGADIPGSGIGLALCKKIVEMHGGAIGCSSTEGVGSSFWFSLPTG